MEFKTAYNQKEYTITLPITQLEYHFLRCRTGYEDDTAFKQFLQLILGQSCFNNQTGYIEFDNEKILQNDHYKATLRHIQKRIADYEIFQDRAVEKATSIMRKEHGEQIATLQSMVSDLLDENARQKKEYEARIISLEKAVSNSTERFVPSTKATTEDDVEDLLFFSPAVSQTVSHRTIPPTTGSITITPMESMPNNVLPSNAPQGNGIRGLDIFNPINRNDKYALQAMRLRELRKERR